jgi:hypothetical protein
MLAASRQDTRKRRENVCHIPKDLPSSWRGDKPANWKGVPCADPWKEDKDGLFRALYIPVHWERAGFAGEAPVCRACGTPFRRTEAWRGWTGFEAACVRKHVPDTPLNLSNCDGPFMVNTPTYFALGLGPMPPDVGERI